MFGTSAKYAVFVCCMLCLSTSGCMTGEVATKLGDGLELQFKEKGKKIEQALSNIGKALNESASQSGERFKRLRDTLVSKYSEQHKAKKLVFFTEDTKVPARPVEEVAREVGRPGERVTPVAKEITSELLSERTLERRGLRLLWKLALDGSAVRYADVNGDRLYVVTKKNRMYAIDLKTGLTRWLYDFERRPDGPPGFNDLYVVISAADIIRVIDKRSGADKWRFETDIQPASRPYCDARVFVFGCWDGDVCGFVFGDRYPAWRMKTGESVFAAPFVLGGFAYAATDKGAFVKYNVTLRVAGMQTVIGSRPVGDLAGTGEFIFVGTENFELVAVRASDGSRGWTHSCGGRVIGGPWLSPDGKTLYYSADDDGLYALVPLTGKPRWKVERGVKPVGVSRDSLFVLKKDGTLSKVDKGTGKVLWSEPTTPFVTAVDHVKSEVMCFISQDGQIYAVAPKK